MSTYLYGGPCDDKVVMDPISAEYRIPLADDRDRPPLTWPPDPNPSVRVRLAIYRHMRFSSGNPWPRDMFNREHPKAAGCRWVFYFARYADDPENADD